MSLVIRRAIEQSYVRPERESLNKLRVSELGYHPFKVMDRILNGRSSEFGMEVQDKMACGDAYEADLVPRIVNNLGATNYVAQFPIFNDFWSGYIDLVANFQKSDPLIVEVKGVDSTMFRFGDFPRSTNVCQLWLYGQLYREKYGVQPALVLYYRSWGKWAEFELTELPGGYIRAVGAINGKEADIECKYRPRLLREQLEGLFASRSMPASSAGADSWTYPEDFEDAGF